MGEKKKKKVSKSEKSKIKQLEKELQEKSEVIEEYQDKLLRLQAEFENYKKKLDREKEEFRKQANESLIKDLLVVVDDFEKGIKEGKKQKGEKKFAQGMELIYKNLEKILEHQGLKKIDALGKKFDPYYHEALLQEESEKDDGIILEELQKGYMLGPKVIRQAKVKVSKKKKA